MYAASVRQALHRADVAAVRLHCEHQARADRLAVDDDRAGPADAVPAADMRPRQAAFVADDVHQHAPGLGSDEMRAPVDAQVDLDTHDARACSSARLVSVATRLRR